MVVSAYSEYRRNIFGLNRIDGAIDFKALFAKDGDFIHLPILR